MSFVPVDVPPGVVKVDSDYAARGRWIDTDKVRFVRGKPQKVGGAQKLVETSFEGIARGAKGWVTFTGTHTLAFGTACDLFILRNGAISNITPYRTDATNLALTDPFTTTNGSAIVSVSDTNHGIEDAGTVVTFSGATAVGGITIDGDYEVTEVVDADSFTITHSTVATSSASGGGSVTASYTLNCGDVDSSYLLGWGIGGWGEGYWGTDQSLSQAVVTDPLVWSMDVYGEDLMVCPMGGTIYHYDSSGGTSRASAVTNAPAQVNYVFVTPERYIFALGCTTTAGSFDGMTVRWPDVDDFTDWTPGSTDTSNQRKLQGGSRLIAGTALTDGISLVWSDQSAFLFQFTGGNSIYASRQVATHCGLVGPHAWTMVNGMAFWMGGGNFWMYAGYVQPIPNVEDIRQWVLKEVNEEQIFKSIAFYNPIFNEVWFVFPSGASKEPDKYVMVNLNDYSWAHGTWTRSAAALYTSGERRPILLGTDGFIYVHEVGDNPDDDSEAMAAHIELAPTDIQGGNTCVDIFGFVPDFQKQSGDIELYVYGLDHPRDEEIMGDTVTISETEKLADLRSAGRQFGMKLTSNVLGGDFRLGTFGLEISSAGTKRGSAG